jgi:hypothetical protein
VTTRMTNDPKWWCGESCATTNVATPDNTWWPKLLPKNDPDDNRWLPWMINVTTCWRPSKFSWWHMATPSGDIYCQSQKLPVLQDHREMTVDDCPTKEMWSICWESPSKDVPSSWCDWSWWDAPWC